LNVGQEITPPSFGVKIEPDLNKSINVTLEVRKFDDVGGGPDMKHGFVRLYGDASLPISPK
jgi:hypothetical protein